MSPNVVLINCDDLGYGDLGCYGSTVHDTPVLDALAAGGARFRDFCMASPLCSPSRAALLTGSYPLRVGFGGPSMDSLPVLFPGQGVGLNPDERTIARLLSDVGYSTLAVGKWHCGDQPAFLPTNHGFDEWFGLPYSNDMGRQATTETDHLEMLNAWLASTGSTYQVSRPPLPLVEGTSVVERQPDQASLTARYVDRCVRFLRENRDQPFFLYLAHMYVHVPIYVEERFREGSRNGAYGAAVASIDWATGVLLAELAELGLVEDTVVLFTSDNGALLPGPDGSGSNGPLRASKGTTWEGGQRVPLIVSWPGHVPTGTVVDDPTTALDLLPTIVGLAGAELPQDRRLDGDDISGLLGIGHGRPQPGRAFLYMVGGNVEAVRVGRWKLHVRKGWEEMCELYDLDADVGEANDLATARPDVVRDLMAHVAAARLELGDEATGVVGSGTRPIGRVAHPRPLTSHDPDDPCTIAEYDLPYRG